MRKKTISLLAVGTILVNSFAFCVTANAAESDNLVVSGKPYYGCVLTANKSVDWYLADSKDGDYTKVATGETYTLDISAVGMWIKAGSGDVYTTPVKDTTKTTLKYAEDFNKTNLGSEWSIPESGVTLNGTQLVGMQTSNSATLTLPSGIVPSSWDGDKLGATEKLVFDMKFSYQDSKGVNLYLLETTGNSKKGTHMVIGDDNSGTSRVWMINSGQTAYNQIVTKTSDVENRPGNGKFHDIRLEIDLNGLDEDRKITASYDKITSDLTSSYGKVSGNGSMTFKQVQFAYNAGKPGAFCVDGLSIYAIDTNSADAESVTLAGAKAVKYGDVVDANKESDPAQGYIAEFDNFNGTVNAVTWTLNSTDEADTPVTTTKSLENGVVLTNANVAFGLVVEGAADALAKLADVFVTLN